MANTATMANGRNKDVIVATINANRENGFCGVDGAADLEKAISETGYGLFNVLLFVAALPAAWSGIFDTTTTAFILASAECDLQLTSLRKGVLAAIPFLGIILASLVWDRVTPYVVTRNLLIVGLLLDTVLNVLNSALDSYYAFLAVKLVTGLLVGGPFSMVPSYLSEFHSSAHKASFARWGGLIINAGIIIPAALGFAIVPMSLDVRIFYRRYTAWRVYLLVCSLVPLVGILTACSLPYTPKQLLESGRHEDALNLLRRMYAFNSNKSPDSFPIRKLLGSQKVQPSRGSFLEESSEKMRAAWYNAKLLCTRPYLRAFSQLGFLQFGSSLLFHTLRLWVPHTFMIITNFDASQWTQDRQPLLTDLLDRRYSITLKDYYDCPNLYDICVQWIINRPVYMKSTIIATTTVTFSFLAGVISGSDFWRKTIVLAAFLIATGSAFATSWIPTPLNILIMVGSTICTSKIASNAVAAISALAIPVQLRATSLSIFANLGNVGAILGNIYLSAVINVATAETFVGLGVVALVCFFLSLVLPGPVKALPKAVAGDDNA